MSRERRLHRSISRPGRADDDVDAGGQRVELRLVGDAAVDGQHAQAEVLAGQGQVAADLERELAGRGDDQRLRLALRKVGVRRVRRDDAALQHRDAEGEGLAGARAGLADQVGAEQGDREGHLLDGEGGGDAAALERVADLGEHPELSEGGHGMKFAFVRAPRTPDSVRAGRSSRSSSGGPQARVHETDRVCRAHPQPLREPAAASSPLTRGRPQSIGSVCAWLNPRQIHPPASRGAAETGVVFEDVDYRLAVVDLLGAIAYGELSAFERLVDDAKLAPTVRDKVEMGGDGEPGVRSRLAPPRAHPRARHRPVRRDGAVRGADRPLPRPHRARRTGTRAWSRPTSATGWPPTSTARSRRTSMPAPVT